MHDQKEHLSARTQFAEWKEKLQRIATEAFY